MTNPNPVAPQTDTPATQENLFDWLALHTTVEVAERIRRAEAAATAYALSVGRLEAAMQWLIDSPLVPYFIKDYAREVLSPSCKKSGGE